MTDGWAVTVKETESKADGRQTWKPIYISMLQNQGKEKQSKYF